MALTKICKNRSTQNVNVLIAFESGLKYLYHPILVSCPDPPHVVGPISGLRSPIRLQKTSLYLHDISDHILNQIEGSENLTLSLFSAVPIDLVAIQAFVSRAMLLSICTEASET